MVEMQMVRPKAGTSVTENRFRPFLKKLGERFKVTVNAYKVTLTSLVIHHYDVAVEGLVNKHGTVGDVPPSLGREIFAALQVMNAFEHISVVYDGRKTVFSQKPLNFPDNKRTFDVNLASPAERAAKRNRSFKVVITKVNEVKLDNLLKYVKRQVGSNPDEGVYIAITALNVLFNHDMMMTHPNSKNKFFPRPQGPHSSEMLFKMKDGIDMWRGYFSSIRMAPGGVILNFDLTSQPMLRGGNLTDVAAAVLGFEPSRSLQGLLPTQLINLSRSLKMMTVFVTRVDKTILRTKIKEVAKSAREMIFEAPVSPDSKVMKKWNVAEYIEFTYNMKLKGPNDPIVRLTGKGWYPLEICHVSPGQKFSKKLSPEQLSEVIQWLTVRPQDRARMLTNGIQNHLRTGTTLDQWGIRLNANPLVISARRLTPPTINYAPSQTDNSQSSDTKAGNGTWNLAGKMLLQPIKVTSWVAIVLGQANHRISDTQAAQALNGLQLAMKGVGMQVSGLQGPAVFVDKNNALLPSDDESVGKWIMSKIKIKPQLIVCFLAEKNAWEYRQLKIFGDSLQGIATQCLSVDKVKSRANPQYFANVTLKINAKLGGVNHSVCKKGQLFSSRTMVMGADVTHPGRDSLEPSIAAVVGSTNQFGSGYAAEFSVQSGGQEIIADLHLMVKQLLIKFHQCNQFLPEKLIFYRDGVSEGQFPDVVAKEVPLVRQAIYAMGEKEIYKAAKIKLTYIICGKRHHFKFGPTTDKKTECSHNGNLLPGVVIDTDIVHPFNFDWYGLSHGGILGTSRASHYTVLVDDSNHSSDNLQTLTYYLCFNYSRATRSVSIATPAYYAHHVCTRIKQMLSGIEVGQSSTSHTDIDLKTALREYQTKANKIKTNFHASYVKAGNFPVNEYWM